LELDDLEDAMYKLWRQGGGKPSGGTVPENEIVMANLQDSVMFARSQDIKPMLVHKRRTIQQEIRTMAMPNLIKVFRNL